MDNAVAAARPYAAAAYRHACEQNTVKSWQAVLGAMAQAVTAVRAVAAGGVLITEAQAAEIALEAAEAAAKQVDDSQKRFVSLLAENDRTFILPAVAARFEALHMAAAGIVTVRVESAMPISDQAAFDGYLEKHLGKKVQTTYQENSDLLGGARVYVNDDVIDASIRGRLDKLAGALSTRAAASSS